ncbi:RING-H2 finger B1A, partial [Prunus dulcis]
ITAENGRLLLFFQKSSYATARSTCCPPVLEEQESLRSHDVAASALSAGLLVHWDLEASTPDTYRPPPPPLPYDMVFGCSRSTDSDSLELSKSNEPHVLAKEDEDVCPICLEGAVPSVAQGTNSYVVANALSLYLHMQTMKQRIQNLSQNASTTITSVVFLSGWKEVMPVLYVIRNWGLTIALSEIANSVDSGWTVAKMSLWDAREAHVEPLVFTKGNISNPSWVAKCVLFEHH